MAGDSSGTELHTKTISMTVVSLVGAALAVAGALASLELLPVALGRVSGGLLFFVSGALPVLLRVGPARPSLFKVLTLSALFSPVLATSLYVLLHLGLGAREAVAGTFLLLGLLQLLGVGRVVQHERLGRTAWLVLALAGACGVAVLVLLFRGSAMRASYHGLLHSALVLGVDRQVPPDHPWMAGGELGYYWFWHAIGALVSRALFVAPTLGLALTNLWAATLLPIALYLTAAPCFRSGKREWLGVLLALFGLNALGAWVWLLFSREWVEPGAPAQLIDSLRVSVGAWDNRLAFGFSKFGNLSSYPTALALYGGALLCGVHAIRSGPKPWGGACAAMCGAALLVNPIVGGLAAASVGLATLLFASGHRVRQLTSLVLWSLPGAWLVLRAGQSYAGESLQLVWREGVVWATVAPVLLLLVPALGLRGSTAGVEASVAVGQRRALGLLLTAALLPLLFHLAIRLPYDNQYKFIRIAALPLGLLAAGGLYGLLERSLVPRLVGGLLALALFVGVLVSNGLGFASYHSLSDRSLPLREEPLALSPEADLAAGGVAAELATLYRWLARHPAFEESDPMLIVNTVAETAPLYGEPAHAAFTDPLRNLQGHEAAPFTGLPLFCDRPSQVLAKETPGWEERIRVVWQLFRERGVLSSEERALLLEDGRPRLLLVSSLDRTDRPGLDVVVAGLGFEEVQRVGDSSVYAWPASFASNVRESTR